MQPLGQMIKDFLSLRFFRPNRANTASANREIQGSKAAQYDIYRSASDCPMWGVFIPVLVRGEKDKLVKSGNPPAEVIEDAWLTIYSQYCQLVGGVQVTALINRAVSINTLDSKIKRIETLLSIAQTMIHDEVCKELTAEGYKVDYLAEWPVYIKQVSAADSRLKTERVKLQQLLSEQPKAPKKAEVHTEEEFTQTLIQISKHVKFQVGKDITVEEYGLYVQDLKKHINALTKQSNGSGRKVK